MNDTSCNVCVRVLPVAGRICEMLGQHRMWLAVSVINLVFFFVCRLYRVRCCVVAIFVAVSAISLHFDAYVLRLIILWFAAHGNIAVQAPVDDLAHARLLPAVHPSEVRARGLQPLYVAVRPEHIGHAGCRAEGVALACIAGFSRPESMAHIC